MKHLLALFILFTAGSACLPDKYETPPVGSIELGGEFEVISTQQFGGSGGWTDRWVLVLAPSDDLDHELDRAVSMMIEAGWTLTTLDCGGDTPPCRPSVGTVLTDGSGAYAYVQTERPELYNDKLDTQGLDPFVLWWRLAYERWGLGR